jgi:hypothetical protein
MYLNANVKLAYAALVAWGAIPRDVGELMIRCRGLSKAQVNEAHPTPSLLFTSLFFKDTDTLLPSLKKLALWLLTNATLGKGKQTYAFEDTDGIRDQSDKTKWGDIFEECAEEEEYCNEDLPLVKRQKI